MTKTRCLAVAAILCDLLGCVPVLAAPITTGRQVIDINGTPMVVFTYRPAGCSDPALLLVFHGIARNARTYRDDARALADRLCLLVVAPVFDKRAFPTWRYQRGGIVKDGVVQNARDWTGTLVLDLVAWARGQEGRPLPYSLLGHSAGGQFLDRLAAFVPTEARGIVIGNAGSYVFASLAIVAPYGLGKVYSGTEGEAALRRYLEQPLTIYSRPRRHPPRRAKRLSRGVGPGRVALPAWIERIQRGEDAGAGPWLDLQLATARTARRGTQRAQDVLRAAGFGGVVTLNLGGTHATRDDGIDHGAPRRARRRRRWASRTNRHTPRSLDRTARRRRRRRGGLAHRGPDLVLQLRLGRSRQQTADHDRHAVQPRFAAQSVRDDAARAGGRQRRTRARRPGRQICRRARPGRRYRPRHARPARDAHVGAAAPAGPPALAGLGLHAAGVHPHAQCLEGGQGARSAASLHPRGLRAAAACARASIRRADRRVDRAAAAAAARYDVDHAAAAG